MRYGKKYLISAQNVLVLQTLFAHELTGGYTLNNYNVFGCLKWARSDLWSPTPKSLSNTILLMVDKTITQEEIESEKKYFTMRVELNPQKHKRKRIIIRPIEDEQIWEYANSVYKVDINVRDVRESHGYIPADLSVWCQQKNVKMDIGFVLCKKNKNYSNPYYSNPSVNG